MPLLGMRHVYGRHMPLLGANTTGARILRDRALRPEDQLIDRDSSTIRDLGITFAAWRTAIDSQLWSRKAELSLADDNMQLFTTFVFLSIISLVRPVLHGLFRVDVASSCGPGADPMSDVVNINNIADIEKTTFADYVTKTTTVTFQNSNDSASSGPEADLEWNSFLPTNNGFLSEDIDGVNGTVYFGIAAFHAMHCLDTVRRMLEIQFNVASNETLAKIQNNPTYSSFYHIHHCLIYLREVVTCNADPALEHDIYYQNGTAIMGGIGTAHTCRDFKALYDISDESDARCVVTDDGA
ncbi:hypothetical protein C8J56DRAFT_1170972 [Mycena floridula]|nr:hypothetical protein C8J56DRAFT_1170972 [Mycena floridula]